MSTCTREHSRTFWLSVSSLKKRQKRDRLDLNFIILLMEERTEDEEPKFGIDPARLEVPRQPNQSKAGMNYLRRMHLVIGEEIKKLVKLMMEKRDYLVKAGTLIAEDDLNIIFNLQEMLSSYIDLIQAQASVTKSDCSKTVEPLLRLKEETSFLLGKLRQSVQLDDELLDADWELETIQKRNQATRQEMQRRKKDLREIIEQLDARNGNVTLICKIRPANSTIVALKAKSPFQIEALTLKEDMTAPKSSKDPKNEKLQAKYPKLQVWQSYYFDHVLEDTSSQQDAIDEIWSLADHMVEGNNSCLLLCGQTGSGKTYTMFGPSRLWKEQITHFDAKMGIVPRLIFEVFKQLEQRGQYFAVTMLITQIYPKEIEGKNKMSSGMLIPFDFIQEIYDVSCPEEGLQLLYRRLKTKRVSSTEMNPYLNSSHFIVKICFESKVEGQHKQGSISLIDLAGSQHFNEGSSPVETVFINLSLSKIQEILSQIKKEDPNLKYNTPFAKVLEPHLKGAKIAVMLAISPDEQDIPRTKKTLSFAQQISA